MARQNLRTGGTGYKMAQVAADHLLGQENQFTGADMSAKLKLLGVDVGGIGNTHATDDGCHSYIYLDEANEVYKRLIVSDNNKYLLGAVLVGDTEDYGNLLQLALNRIELPENPDVLILPHTPAANRRSAWNPCRTVHKSVPVLMSPKETLFRPFITVARRLRRSKRKPKPVPAAAGVFR